MLKAIFIIFVVLPISLFVFSMLFSLFVIIYFKRHPEKRKGGRYRGGRRPHNYKSYDDDDDYDEEYYHYYIEQDEDDDSWGGWGGYDDYDDDYSCDPYLNPDNDPYIEDLIS